MNKYFILYVILIFTGSCYAAINKTLYFKSTTCHVDTDTLNTLKNMTMTIDTSDVATTGDRYVKFVDSTGLHFKSAVDFHNQLGIHGYCGSNVDGNMFGNVGSNEVDVVWMSASTTTKNADCVKGKYGAVIHLKLKKNDKILINERCIIILIEK